MLTQTNNCVLNWTIFFIQELNILSINKFPITFIYYKREILNTYLPSYAISLKIHFIIRQYSFLSDTEIFFKDKIALVFEIFFKSYCYVTRGKNIMYEIDRYSFFRELLL